MVTPAYQPRDPSHTVLYQVIADHLETFLATLDADPMAKGLPEYVKEECYAYLQCGVLAHGFVRLGCDTCPHKMLLAFSCKRRGFCPSCAGRRMAQLAAHLVTQVIPWVPVRQWGVSVPIPLRYWMASSKDLTAAIHTIIRRAISQYDVNAAVKRGMDRTKIQAGSLTCVQRFGGSINVNVPYHFLFFEGVSVDRTDQGLTPRFVKVAPPSDADIAAVVATISRRVIRTLRQRGYLEAGLDAAVATGYDPLRDDEPELARTMAASVQQRIAFGERAGQKVRRIGSGFGYEGERPALTGTRCASVHGFSLHANVSVPAPRMHLVRYGGCLAPHSRLRHLITPTPRQQGMEAPEAGSASPRRGRARLLKRVFAFDMERCPACGRGRLRLIAAITRGEVIGKILRHLKLATEPPPIAEARACQAPLAWTSP
jgi:hypothetical protein